MQYASTHVSWMAFPTIFYWVCLFVLQPAVKYNLKQTKTENHARPCLYLSHAYVHTLAHIWNGKLSWKWPAAKIQQFPNFSTIRLPLCSNVDNVILFSLVSHSIFTSSPFEWIQCVCVCVCSAEFEAIIGIVRRKLLVVTNGRTAVLLLLMMKGFFLHWQISTDRLSFSSFEWKKNDIKASTKERNLRRKQAKKNGL